MEAGEGSRHGGVLCSQHTAQRAVEGSHRVLGQLRHEGSVVHGDDLGINIALLIHVMHPGHGLFILGINGAVVDLAAIVRIGIKIIQAAECGAEIPQAIHVVGAEGDLIVGAVAVQVGGLDQMPVVLPVLQGHGAFDAQLFQPVGADDVGHIAGDFLIQHGHIINIAVAVSQCFFDTVPLVDLLLQVGHVVLDVIVQGQDHAGLAVLQNFGGGHIHNDVRQLSIHHHKIQALVVIVLRGVIKFKIHIEFFAQDLPDIHLLGSNLVCGLGFQDAHGDALVGSSCSGTGSRRSSRRGRAATALQDTQCQGSDHSAAYGASADFSFFHKIFSSLIYGMGRGKSPCFHNLRSARTLPTSGFSLLRSISCSFWNCNIF